MKRCSAITSNKDKDKDKDDQSDDGDDGYFEVDSIIDKRPRGKSNTMEYLVRWVGCGSEEDTWELKSDLRCSDLLADFEKKEAAGLAAPSGATTGLKAGGPAVKAEASGNNTQNNSNKKKASSLSLLEELQVSSA